jgi:hypothetical protein
MTENLTKGHDTSYTLHSKSVTFQSKTYLLMVTIQIYACYNEIATREIISNWNNCTVTPGTNEPQANNRNVLNQCI